MTTPRKLFDALGGNQQENPTEEKGNLLNKFRTQLVKRDQQYKEMIRKLDKDWEEIIVVKPEFSLTKPFSSTASSNDLYTNGQQTAEILSALETRFESHPGEMNQNEQKEFQNYVKSATDILTQFNALNFQEPSAEKLGQLNEAIAKFEKDVNEGMQNSESIIAADNALFNQQRLDEINRYDSKYCCIKLLSNLCYGIGIICATLGTLVAMSSLIVGGYGLRMDDPTVIARAPLALKLAIIGGALVLAGAAFGLLGLGIAKLLEKYAPRPTPLDPANLPKMSEHKKAAYEGLKGFAETAKNIHPKK